MALATLYGADSESLELPLIVRFGTWVGGDMDGAADVHAKSIRETLARQQQVIINNYFGECQALAQQLSQSAVRVGVSAAVTRRVEEYRTLLPGAPGLTPARHDRMPYRVLFGQIAERLRNTLDGRPNGYDRPGAVSRRRGPDRRQPACEPRHARRLLSGASLAGAHRYLRLSTWRRSICGSTPACTMP